MKIITISGAGLSADSGISTFREDNGTWENFDLDVVCNFRTWKVNYDTVHDFYDERRMALSSVLPNKMHYFFAELEKEYDAIHLTQNVDDLLERSGCENVVHLHGKLWETKCQFCKKVTDIGHNSSLRICETCKKSEVKPNVVFFHELAPEYATLANAIDNVDENDIIIVIGTSGVVIPVNDIVRSANCRAILVDKKYGDHNRYLYDQIIIGNADSVVDQLRETIRSMI